MADKKKMTPQRRYHEKHAYNMTVTFFDTTEADMIGKLKSVENRSGYIKQLIRADIARESQKQ